MKIIFIGPRGLPAKYGGIDTHTENLAVYLARNSSYEVTIYSRKPYTTLDGDSFNGVKVKKIYSLPNKYLDTFVYGFIATLSATSENPDVIHYQGGSALFSFIPRLFNIKIVYTVHGIEWRRSKWGKIAKLLLRLAELISVLPANIVITVSQQLQNYYQGKYGKRRKIVYIPNSVEIHKPLPLKVTLRYGIEKDKYILSVGRLVPEKGFYYLIEAYKKLNCGLKLVITGDVPHSDKYATALKDIADRNIIFTGYVNGDLLAELYSNAYIYVNSSELEGMSISLLEAMSYGRCVLVSDIQENKNVVEHCGVVFRNKDVNNLAEKLDFLCKNESFVKDVGEKAKVYVKANFNWTRALDKLNVIYGSLRG